ncbi:homeobox protein notochord-like [Pyxicephalus adspersus]|uniref:Homeobox domain-containing protein n=1 Tax=Pyxicephalus adspersus TaxID=30357 RepID=A0AAV3ASI5_PYXAD|nr:TPA: hypothetical protein GDO54_009708 [Pyxicephalus adspersus]
MVHGPVFPGLPAHLDQSSSNMPVTDEAPKVPFSIDSILSNTDRPSTPGLPQERLTWQAPTSSPAPYGYSYGVMPYSPVWIYKPTAVYAHPMQHPMQHPLQHPMQPQPQIRAPRSNCLCADPLCKDRGFAYTQHTLSNLTWRTGPCKIKRIRTVFTPEQLERLEKEFLKQQYMVGTERVDLAATLNLSETQVKVWFQNRRIKWRKQSSEQKKAKLSQFGVTSSEDSEFIDENKTDDDN